MLSKSATSSCFRPDSLSFPSDTFVNLFIQIKLPAPEESTNPISKENAPIASVFPFGAIDSLKLYQLLAYELIAKRCNLQ